MNVSKIRFHREAETEILEGAAFYENQEPGLEKRFLDEMDRGLFAITESPKGWPIITGSIRKKVLHRFPYSILFRIEKATIFVLAVMHHRRRPNYWQNRRS